MIRSLFADSFQSWTGRPRYLVPGNSLHRLVTCNSRLQHPSSQARFEIWPNLRFHISCSGAAGNHAIRTRLLVPPLSVLSISCCDVHRRCFLSNHDSPAEAFPRISSSSSCDWSVRVVVLLPIRHSRPWSGIKGGYGTSTEVWKAV